MSGKGSLVVIGSTDGRWYWVRHRADGKAVYRWLGPAKLVWQ
jgi:hypothetical protein